MPLTSAQRKKRTDYLYDLIETHRLSEAFHRSARDAARLPGLRPALVDEITRTHMDLDRLLFYMADERDLTATEFQLLWSFAHSEVRIVQRRAERDALFAIGEKLTNRKRKKSLLKMTREELEGWAMVHGVSIWLDVPLAIFSGMYDYFLHLGKFDEDAALLCASVGDVLATDSHVHLKHTLSKWLSSTAADKLTERAKARAQLPSSAVVLEQIEQLEPASERFEELFARVKASTTQMLADAEPASSLLIGPEAHVGHTPPWDALVIMSFVRSPCNDVLDDGALVTIDLNDEAHPITCSCLYTPHRACPAKIDAGITLLSLIAKTSSLPKRARFADINDVTKKLVRELAHALATPAWQRRIDHLFGDLDEDDAPIIPHELDGMPCWFGWCIRTKRSGELDLYPALIRPKKRGDGVISKRLKFEAHDLDEIELPKERERLKRWHLIQENARYRFDISYLPLIMELAGHKHVYAVDTKTYPCEVRDAAIKLRVSPGSEGQIDLEVLAGERVLSEQEVFDVVDEELLDHGTSVQRYRIFDDRAEFVYYTADRRTRRMLEKVIAQRDHSFSSRSKGYLLEKLSAKPELQAHIEIAEELRGEQLEGEHHFILRLSMRQGVLSVGFRVEPIKGSVTHHPGGGPSVVYTMREGQPYYAERDLDAELERARALIDRLGFEHGAGDLMSWDIEDPEHALDLLDTMRALVEQDETLEIAWDSAPPKIVGQAQMQRTYLKVSLRQKLLAISGEVRVGEGPEQKTISIVQLLDAAREQRRWVQIEEDHWVKIDDTLREQATQLARFTDGTEKESAELPVMAAPMLEEMSELGVEIDGPPKWLEMLDGIRKARTLEVEIPKDLDATLRAYQVDGVKWLLRLSSWAPGACLADDMGLGKTIQAIALLLSRAHDGAALVVAPTSLGFNWEEEIERFAPSLKTVRLRSKADCEALLKKRRKSFYKHKVFITSYELLARNIERFEQAPWRTFVLDEAQAIKNSATNRAQAVHKLEADFKLALTGTPLENHTGELWSLMRTIAPGLLGSQPRFKKRFQIPIERHGDLDARRTLARLIAPFILRRVKREVAQDLPERTDVRLRVELSTPEQRLYDELREALVAKLTKTEGDTMLGKEFEESSRFDILAAITRLRQAACHPKLYHPNSKLSSSKVALLRERLEAVHKSGYAALVFSQFTSLLKLVREDLEASDMRVAYLDGSLPAKKRKEVVQAFQRGDYDVFLLSIKAGGVGLNLTRANAVFLLDPWWNPAVEDQATDRAHRIGQKQPVTVYRLVSSGTIEEAIYELHEEKRALFDGVMQEAHDAGKKKNALSVQELSELITG